MHAFNSPFSHSFSTIAFAYCTPQPPAQDNCERLPLPPAFPFFLSIFYLFLHTLGNDDRHPHNTVHFPYNFPAFFVIFLDIFLESPRQGILPRKAYL
jgi:hypothetical protein